MVSDFGGHHVSYSLAADTGGKEYEQAGMRAAQEGFGLEAPQLLEAVDEFGDGIGLQILFVFPTFVLQQTRNSLAVRRLVPQGLDKTELVWTCFGFTTDDEDMTERRLRQANLIGPRRLHLHGGRRGAGIRAARRDHRAGFSLGGRDGRRERRLRRQPRHRGGGPRLLESLSGADGDVSRFRFSYLRDRCA